MKDPLNLKSGATFSPLRLFLILLILGFGLRMAFGIVRYRGDLLHLTGPAFITSWSHDGLEHVLIAKAILSGEGYIMENFPLPAGKHVRYAGQDALFKAPLYQYFLAGVFAISGFSFKLFFPLQALVGGLTCGLLGLIAWETFKSPGAALLAGIAGAIHPVLVNAASQPYNEDVFFFLFIAAIWAFLVWFRTREIKWAVACGIMVGLCTLTRESGIPLLAAMGAVGILSTPRDFKAWIACGAIALSAFAVVAPWTLRNYIRFHAFIPVAAIVGEDLATGNNDCVARESLFTSYWSEGPCVDLNRQIIAARALTPMVDLPAGVQYDRLSRRVAIHFITEHPAAYAKLAIRRLWTSLLPFAPRGNQRGYERIVLTLYWLLIFPAGMIGLFLRLRRPEPRTLFLALIIALSFLSIMAVLYWSDLRFRVGIDLLLGCFAAWTTTGFGKEEKLNSAHKHRLVSFLEMPFSSKINIRTAAFPGNRCRKTRRSSKIDGPLGGGKRIMPGPLWDEWLGRKATRRLAGRILPLLRWNQEIWGETVREHLTSPVRWLDAGCGWRLLDKDLDPLEDDLVRRAGTVVGVDLDFPHLGKHVNISRRACASLAALPFADASFDLITCNMVAEHLPDPLTIFQEISRVLAPGGTFMVHTPNTRNYLVFANILAKKLLPRALVLKLVHDGREEEDIYPTYYRANNERALRRLGDSVKLQPHFVCFLTQPQPYSRFFAPAAFFELLFMRATMTRPLNRFAATIMMGFRKPHTKPDCCTACAA